jgi:hypothetical protein
MMANVEDGKKVSGRVIMMVLAMMWSIVSPLSLFLAMWLIAKGLAALDWPGPEYGPVRMGVQSKVRASVAIAVVLANALALWDAERSGLKQWCASNRGAQIYKTERVDGFYFNDHTASSFGLSHLHDKEGFAWMEAPRKLDKKLAVRYEYDHNGLKSIEPVQKQSKHEVLLERSTPWPGVSVTTQQVWAMEPRELMGQASLAQFDGGRAKWFFGVWGASSCPSGWGGSEKFKAYIDLVKNVLGSGVEAIVLEK